MRRALVLAALGLATFGAVALASDPGGHVQNAKDLLNQAQAELDAAIAEPPQTITETITMTVTETATPTPTTPPPVPCAGVQVAAGTDLAAAEQGNPAGTTYCLAAGNYSINTTVLMQAGDKFIGAGRTQTFLTGSAINFFSPQNGCSSCRYTVQDLDIDGPQAAPTDNNCAPNNCGVVFTGGNPELIDLRCHDTGTACVAKGSNDVILANVECDHNGFHIDTQRGDFRSAACVKINTGSLTVTDSFIHDNNFVGLWCDFCDDTQFVVTNSTLTGNDFAAIQWEVSGNFVAGDSALIQGNTIQNGSFRLPTTDVNFGGGCGAVVVSDSRNITIEGNTFGGNGSCQTPQAHRAVWIVDGTRDPAPNANILIRNNTLNGDAIVSCTSTGVTCTNNT